MTSRRKRLRFAVVGLGDIAREAVLPAFGHVENAELVGLVSGSPDKLEELATACDVQHTGLYGDYERVLRDSAADAVYVALPNHLHCEYTVRAARAGAHVLCEKPMAVTEDECRQMIEACDDAGVALMIGYRLHFEAANMQAAAVVESGEIGEPRLFDAVFSRHVEEDDVRLMPVEKGGGTVYDLGVYCINAARYLFRTEPTEVVAAAEFGRSPRFEHTDEMTSAALRFSGGRLATFTTSFSGTSVDTYRVVGSKGEIVVDPAFDYRSRLGYEVRVGDQVRHRRFEATDQFATEIEYFARRVLAGEPIEPDGYEGLADVRVVCAIYESARTGRPVRIEPVPKTLRPGVETTLR